MSQTEQSKPAHASRKKSKRLAAGIGIIAICYLLVSYLLLPLGWKRYGEKHPSFDDNPRLTKTADGHPGDALNVALTGTPTQLKTIMGSAGWYPADALGIRSDARIAVDTVLKRSYDQAPVSKLFLYRRPEDFAFEQPVGGDPRHRHHVRFWRSEASASGRPTWLGAATFDKRVGFSDTTGQITHHTAADIDAERAHVFATLRGTNDLAEFYEVPGFHKQLEGFNGGGDPWHTDGALWVGVIDSRLDANHAPGTLGETTPAESVTVPALQADLRVLQSSSSQLNETIEDIKRLANEAPWRADGFFDAPQQDQIEHLLFRYLACRHALRELADTESEHDARFVEADAKRKRSIIAFDAGFQVVLSDASLVRAFRGDTVAIEMLNEEFYRSRIPANTYERLRLGITDEEQLRSLNRAFLLFTSALKDTASEFAELVRQEPPYAELVRATKTAAHDADAIVQELVASESTIAPELDNELQHTRVAQLLRDAEAEGKGLLSAARAHLFKGVSRIKNPESHLIRFSAEQKRQVYDSLEPGDIILTYTAGYMSDIFIPGAFKHAITYVGSVRDRQQAGLSADHLDWLTASERQLVLNSVIQERLPSGQAADVIEAVGEGVIFNHLGHLMDTHVNRLLILRPQVTPEQRTVALANVFLFLGDEYDFEFDFADASRQVCTEVVYRALDGKGPIDFSLVRRAGHETLSADDVANAYLSAPGKAFEFVLLAEGVHDSPEYRAQLLTGDAGKNRLGEIMTAASD